MTPEERALVVKFRDCICTDTVHPSCKHREFADAITAAVHAENGRCQPKPEDGTIHTAYHSKDYIDGFLAGIAKWRARTTTEAGDELIVTS